jgi:hypothetical protein
MAGKGLSGRIGELYDISGRLLREKEEAGSEEHAMPGKGTQD